MREAAPLLPCVLHSEHETEQFAHSAINYTLVYCISWIVGYTVTLKCCIPHPFYFILFFSIRVHIWQHHGAVDSIATSQP